MADGDQLHLSLPNLRPFKEIKGAHSEPRQRRLPGYDLERVERREGESAPYEETPHHILPLSLISEKGAFVLEAGYRMASEPLSISLSLSLSLRLSGGRFEQGVHLLFHQRRQPG